MFCRVGINIFFQEFIFSFHRFDDILYISIGKKMEMAKTFEVKGLTP